MKTDCITSYKTAMDTHVALKTEGQTGQLITVLSLGRDSPWNKQIK